MEKIGILQSETRVRRIRMMLSVVTWIGILVSVFLVGYLYIKGYLTDTQKLQTLVNKAGVWGPFLFVFLQIVQVAIPILPGGVTTVAGVFLFGNVWGFIWNYIGICLGSILAFHIGKVFGRPILEAFFSPKTIEAYEHRTNEKSRFATFFALAIFFPFAPDDFLCYLAGTTSMSYRKFAGIILLGKPASLLIYSLGLSSLISKVLGMF